MGAARRPSSSVVNQPERLRFVAAPARRRGLVDRVMDELLSEDDRMAPIGWAGVAFAMMYVGAHVAVWYWKGGFR